MAGSIGPGYDDAIKVWNGFSHRLEWSRTHPDTRGGKETLSRLFNVRHLVSSLLPMGRTAWIVFALLLLAALAHHVPFSLLAEQRDAGELLLTGRSLLAGRLPYTDGYITKTPGAAYLIAVALAVSGQSLLAVRVLVALANLISALGTGLLCRALGWSRQTGLLAGLLFLIAAPQFEGAQVLTEPFLTPCAVFALYVFVRGLTRRRLGWLALAGALCALAAWMKQVGILVLAPALLALAVEFQRRKEARRWLTLAGLVLIVGCGVTLLGLAATAVRSANAEAFWRCAILGPTHRPTQDWQEAQVRFARRMLELPAIWVPAGLLLLVELMRLPTTVRAGKTNWPILFLGTACVCCLAPVLHRQYPHYFLPGLPFAVILATVGWEIVVRRVLARRQILPAVGLLLLAALMLYPMGAQFVGAIGDLRRGATVFDDFRVAKELRAAAGEGSVLIVPAEAQFYFLCDLEPPSPELYFYEASLRLMSRQPDLPKDQLIRSALLAHLHDERIGCVLLFGDWDDWDHLPPEERTRWVEVASLRAWTYEPRQYVLSRVRVLRRG
jgi:hypothetical protein